jgi:hypothetical protein
MDRPFIRECGSEAKAWIATDATTILPAFLPVESAQVEGDRALWRGRRDEIVVCENYGMCVL